MNPRSTRRLSLALSAATLLLLITACASSSCPDGWDEVAGGCSVKESHVNDVRDRIGETGVFGSLGHQGTGLPPTGAGGGFQPAMMTALTFHCQTDCEDATVVTDDRGRFETALAAGDYCVSGQRPRTFGDAGTDATLAGVGLFGDCFSVTEGSLTELRLDDF